MKTKIAARADGDKIESEDVNTPRIDWFIFGGGTLLLLAVVIPILVAPQWSERRIAGAFRFITEEVGIFYIIAACTIFVYLLAIALGEKGRLVLGPPGVKPAYSRFSWVAMLFCTGIGASLVYWGATEWTFYYDNPPFSVEPRSDAAILWASSYGMFHWGPLAWALYCLPTVAFCLSYHYKGTPILRLSAACQGVLGRHSRRWPGRVIDLLFIVGLLGTAATGLAFGVELVTSAVTRVADLPDDYRTQLGVMLVVTLLIAYSVYRGLDKGIKVLSVINAVLALVLIAFVLVVGPTRFILEMGVVSVGHIAQNFIAMITWSDPLARDDFVESWTIFYWAWWLALGPFVGMFVAKISRGRTLRQVIFGMIGWGSFGCAIFFVVLGNYALDLELSGAYPVVQRVVDESPSAAIARIVELLPFGTFLLVYLGVIGVIFAATTYDSATYTLAAGSTRFLAADQHPARPHRVYWAFALGMLPSVLLFIGGLKPLQTASIVASLPLLFVYVLLMVSTQRMLKAAPRGP